MRSPLLRTAVAVLASVSAMAAVEDEFEWLEEIEGERALEWVRAQNDRTLGELTKDERYSRFYDAALAIAEDKSRIPMGSLRDGFIYNFWQDETNVRGLWRRATLDSYRTPEPQWETLLDVDALASAEGRNWVFQGVECLPPAGKLCLVQLSDGGKDAAVHREFDVQARAFVEGGFALPEAKTDVVWKDENTLLVATDWGPGTLTESGYPYIVKQWTRGRPLADAEEILRGEVAHVGVGPFSVEGMSEDGKPQRLLGIHQAETFYTSTHWALDSAGKPARMTLPPKVSVEALYHGQLVFRLKQDWAVGAKSWKSGALLSVPLVQATAAEPAVNVLIVPGPRDALEEVAATRSGVLVASYSNVRGRVLRFSLTSGRWTYSAVPLPDSGAVGLVTADEHSDTAFVSYQDFLQPTTLYSVEVANKQVAKAKSLPAFFDASRYVTEQLEATSKDGTRVPYFVVRSKAFTARGDTPTLLYGYGGFEVSMLPTYSATIGKLWLDEGGAFVLANIRGGGEFGPAWHDAGLKTKRQTVYDDFIAVAEDLIAHRITSPRHLGIEGGSNGGLLMGVMLTQRPELFGAAVVQVPLLDMLRFHKLLAGASWVDEYGSPDVPEERAWLERLSPYRNLAKREDFPVPFFLTSTKDDRVHPGHARKYAAKMESLGMPFYYYENIEGGHSAAANLRERAKRQALEFTYLARRLEGSPEG
jgi:prolyl oligopeptidase